VPEELQSDLIYRLGNYTLLSASDNRNIGNGLLDSKIDVYRNSDYALSSEITRTEWNSENIESRQNCLASRACVIWKSDFSE
jgi:hypothetical protein